LGEKKKGWTSQTFLSHLHPVCIIGTQPEKIKALRGFLPNILHFKPLPLFKYSEFLCFSRICRILNVLTESGYFITLWLFPVALGGPKQMLNENERRQI
jgi:hypothetical protein